jgi:hypothetical protein
MALNEGDKRNAIRRIHPMNPLLVLFTICLLPIAAGAQTPRPRPAPAPINSPRPIAPAAEGLTNVDVIKMVKATLGEDVILRAIESASQRHFDLSTDGLIQLKVAGVTDRIILVMQSDGKILPVAPPAPVSAPIPPKPPSDVAGGGKANDVTQPHEPGIYVFASSKLVQLEPNVAASQGAGAGSMMKSGLTMGLKKVKAKASIRGPKATTRIDGNAEFYFYGASFNPNEFVLVKLESNDENREIVTGQVGMLGFKNGIREEDQLKTTITRLDGGIYKVVSAKNLKPNEYGFINAASGVSVLANGVRLWDFGVER